jgi:hypothetical protein
MDGPDRGTRPGEIPWQYVLIGAGALVLLWIARRKGWLDPPSGHSGVLLAVALGLAVGSGAGCRWRRPWFPRRPCCPRAAAATSESLPNGPPTAGSRAATHGQIAPATPLPADLLDKSGVPPGGLRVVDRVTAEIEDVIRHVRLIVGTLIGLSVANVLVALRIWYLVLNPRRDACNCSTHGGRGRWAPTSSAPGSSASGPSCEARGSPSESGSSGA